MPSVHLGERTPDRTELFGIVKWGGGWRGKKETRNTEQSKE